MISVLINAPDDPRALTRLLTALVPAGAEGPSHGIADDAGAGLYGAFAEAFEKAKGPWIAGLPAGPSFSPDWMELIVAHLAREPQQPARIVARRVSLSRGPEGWLVPKRLATSAIVVEQDLQRLARRGGRLRVLDRR
jgi:hypothetical protein